MIRNLTCACCGSDAGRFHQFHNQDTGFGLCWKCHEWIKGRGMVEDMPRTYGLPGLNLADPITGGVPDTVVNYGRQYDAVRFDGPDYLFRANAFMQRTGEVFGAIVNDDDGGIVWLALMADKGTPIKPGC